jgi:hypothetical protein
MHSSLESGPDMRLLAAALLALVLPASATAALEVKLSVPSSPKKGASSVVQLRPYWTEYRSDGTCCRLEPADVRYPFRVEAVSPTGRVFRVVFRRTKNRFVWAGSFVFSRRGKWTLRAPQWGPRYSRNFGARPRVRIAVRG